MSLRPMRLTNKTYSTFAGYGKTPVNTVKNDREMRAAAEQDSCNAVSSTSSKDYKRALDLETAKQKLKEMQERWGKDGSGASTPAAKENFEKQLKKVVKLEKSIEGARHDRGRATGAESWSQMEKGKKEEAKSKTSKSDKYKRDKDGKFA